GGQAHRMLQVEEVIPVPQGVQLGGDRPHNRHNDVILNVEIDRLQRLGTQHRLNALLLFPFAVADLLACLRMCVVGVSPAQGLARMTLPTHTIASQSSHINSRESNTATGCSAAWASVCASRRRRGMSAGLVSCQKGMLSARSSGSVARPPCV